MNIRFTILILLLIPIAVAGGFAFAHWPMNAAVIAVLGAVTIWLGYTRYARRIDREVIQPSATKATPARMYMDGVDFMPTSRNVLYGYHFKSIAAAGPIVGPIAAAMLWGWLPSLLWLILGVTFLGWASDYSAIMVAVRNDGNSLSAIAHRLIAPRTRIILFVFIFFYLLLLAGAFVGIMAGIFDPRADVPFGIFMLAVMGLLMGQMLYRWKMDLILVTFVAVARHARFDGYRRQGHQHRQGHDSRWQTGNGAWSLAAPINSMPSRNSATHSTRITGRRARCTRSLIRRSPILAWPRPRVTPDGKIVPKYVDPERRHQDAAVVHLLVPVRFRLLVSGHSAADLAFRPADELYRLLGDVPHHRPLGTGRGRWRRARAARQSRDAQGDHLPDQGVLHLDADDAGQGRGREPAAGTTRRSSRCGRCCS